MKMKPTLAICIPAYNAAGYLPRLLESVNNQTVPFDEVLVYDDCSTDATSEVAARYGAKVVRGTVNRGCSFGKNTLAQATACDWLHFHDADDALYPNFVERAHEWMAREDTPEVVFFGFEYVDAHTDKLISVGRYDSEQLERDPVSYTIRTQINTICGIYRREAFLQAGGFDLDPEVLYNEDVAMHCQLARRGLRFAADPVVTVINYWNGNSMSSSNRAKCIRAQFHVMRKAAEASAGRHAAEISNRLWEIARGAATNLDWETADACIGLALSLGSRAPKHERLIYRVACRFNPYVSARAREYLIRLLKPHLREHNKPSTQLHSAARA